MVIQGTADPFISIDGGEGSGVAARISDGGAVISASEARAFWAQKNGCDAAANIVNVRRRVADGTSVKKYTYTNCMNGANVIYYIVDGMGHSWPPVPSDLPQIGGITTGNINATDTVWAFFSAHTR